MATLADLFSIFAFPVALLAYHVARRLSQRSRMARESVLLEEDRKDREHVTHMIRMCRQLVLGLSAGVQAQPTLSMVAVPQIAASAGAIAPRYGHLVSDEGRMAAAAVEGVTMEILGAGAMCGTAHAASMAASLDILAGSVLDLDAPSLVERRRRAADASDPAAKWELAHQAGFCATVRPGQAGERRGEPAGNGSAATGSAMSHGRPCQGSRGKGTRPPNAIITHPKCRDVRAA